MKKMKLQLDDLAVESFSPGGGAGPRGTVRARGDCTQGDTCVCDTAYAVCGTGPATIYSCDETGYCESEFCESDLCETEGCASGDWRCGETVRCPTPPITPGC
jgi:hypothetical protein